MTDPLKAVIQQHLSGDESPDGLKESIERLLGGCSTDQETDQ